MRYAFVMIALLAAHALVAAEKVMPPTTTAPAPGATTRPVAKASIAIEAVQGTKGGPKISGDPVTVELLIHGRDDAEAKVIEARLDEHGVAMLEDIDLSMPFTPRVTVEHDGTSFEADGVLMHSGAAKQKISVTVYETTAEAPAWEVTMRHVIVQPSPHGVYITEMLAVNNPSDHAWLGAPDASGMRSSVVLALPPGADTSKLTMGGGLHSCCAKIIGGKIVNTAVLSPGVTRYHLRYLLPAGKDRTAIEVVAPAPVKHMMIMVPQSKDIQFQAEGLLPGDVLDFRGKPMQSYLAADLAAGESVSMTVSAPILTGMPDQQAEPGASDDSQDLVIIGGGLLLLVGIVLLLVRPGKKAPADKT